MVTCLGRGADLHMAQLMPLPLTISCSSKSSLVLPSFLVPALPDGPGQSPGGCKTVVVGFLPCKSDMHRLCGL